MTFFFVKSINPARADYFQFLEQLCMDNSKSFNEKDPEFSKLF